MERHSQTHSDHQTRQLADGLCSQPDIHTLAGQQPFILSAKPLTTRGPQRHAVSHWHVTYTRSRSHMQEFLSSQGWVPRNQHSSQHRVDVHSYVVSKWTFTYTGHVTWGGEGLEEKSPVSILLQDRMRASRKYHCCFQHHPWPSFLDGHSSGSASHWRDLGQQGHHSPYSRFLPSELALSAGC